MMQFVKATKQQLKARVALDGPSGAGKTYTALVLATALAGANGKIAVIDTERGSAKLYADKFNFDVLELSTFSPATYTEAIDAAEQAGYSVVVIDSLTHAWEGEEGALDQVDKAATRQQGNHFTAWKDVTPLHRRMVDAILQSKCHVVATMRSKMEYVQEKDDRGKTTIRKVGMAPIQRQGMEYEFTVVGDMDIDHHLSISKTRCDILTDKVYTKPTVKDFQAFVSWLDEGEAVKAAPKPEPETYPTPEPKPAVKDEQPAKEYGAMTYEDACNITGSDGSRYGNATNAELQGKKIGILKALKNPNLDNVKQSAYDRKLSAIDILLAVPESERLERAGQEKLI